MFSNPELRIVFSNCTHGRLVLPPRSLRRRLPVYYSARMAPDLKVFTEDDVAKVRLRQTDINSMQKP